MLDDGETHFYGDGCDEEHGQSQTPDQPEPKCPHRFCSRCNPVYPCEGQACHICFPADPVAFPAIEATP